MKELFDFQASLMEKLAPVERELGYTPPPIPLDFNQRAHQDWFRLMSWYFTEELVEVITAKPEDRGEELADALHFSIELCILAGVDHERVQSHSQQDLFEDCPISVSLMSPLITLGRAVNLLKAKHWKRNPQPLDLPDFQSLVSLHLYQLLNYIRTQGFDPKVIYMAKHQKNEERIKTQY